MLCPGMFCGWQNVSSFEYGNRLVKAATNVGDSESSCTRLTFLVRIKQQQANDLVVMEHSVFPRGRVLTSKQKNRRLATRVFLPITVNSTSSIPFRAWSGGDPVGWWQVQDFQVLLLFIPLQSTFKQRDLSFHRRCPVDS